METLDEATARAKDLSETFEVDMTVFAERNPLEKYVIIDGETLEITTL